MADARYAVTVPAGVDPAEAAPLTCAGVTTYRAVKVGGVTPGDRVAIFGIGVLGHLAQQYAQIFGGETIAIDVNEEKLTLAKRLGAAHAVNAATTDPVAAIEALGGADVAVVLAADPTVLEQAHASLRPGGRLILVSLPKDNTMALPTFQTFLNGIRGIGSIVGTRPDLAEVFRVHAAGRTQVFYENRKTGADQRDRRGCPGRPGPGPPRAAALSPPPGPTRSRPHPEVPDGPHRPGP
ncbi:zinc-binding dehydrogenase, partial [Actinoplanes philippinensis]|uniref:zinc-binding dehydrogenase n=1 Tax=Actinoplanes philippinensis TaxID=35752 RepID=UPI0033F0634B